MPAVDLTRVADGVASHSVDRRTVLLGAAGALAAAGLAPGTGFYYSDTNYNLLG